MQIPPIEPEGERPDDVIKDSRNEFTDRLIQSGNPQSSSSLSGIFSENSGGNPDDPGRDLSNEAGELPVASGTHSSEIAISDEPRFYTLDLRFIKSERVGNAVFTCLVFLGALIWIAIRWWMEGVDLFQEILAGASIVVVVIIAVFSWIWPKKEFQHTQWRATDAGLEIHKGVLWRHRIIVPMTRVQHADVTQGPVQRMFGLGTLVVHTAGTSNASVDLAGIDHQAAIEVRDMIIRFRSDKRAS